MAKKKHEPKCDCIFCNSKCPECGSEAIHVKFTVGYEYSNRAKDTIMVNNTEKSIEIECEDCESDFRNDGFVQDERLDPLYWALFKCLDLPGMKTFDIKDGEIESRESVLVIEPV